MCMSVHEMKSSRIERDLQAIKDVLAKGGDQKYWEWRMENLEKVLKERANNGTYETAGKYS